jgi:hypothetical protein
MVYLIIAVRRASCKNSLPKGELKVAGNSIYCQLRKPGLAYVLRELRVQSGNSGATISY